MEEIRGPAGRNMWEKLSNVQEEVLANYLKATSKNSLPCRPVRVSSWTA